MRPILPLLLSLALPACAQDGPKPPRVPASVPLSYVMVHDTGSGAVLPRLADTRDPRARAVNELLDTLSRGLRCDPAYVRHANPQYDLDTRVAYAADGVLSVHIRVSAECGAVHDMHGVNLSTTFDLGTGAIVPFRQLFADYDRDAQSIIRTIFPEHTARADSLVAAGGTHPQAGGEEECTAFYAARALAVGDIEYTFSEAGLVVEPALYHHVRHCVEQMVVPYERLASFAAPEGILARVAGAHAARASSRTS